MVKLGGAFGLMSAQTLYAVVYLEINLMSALLVAFIRFKTLGISQMVSQRNFSLAIDAEIVFFLSDTIAVLIANGLLPHSSAGLMAAKTVYFFSTALMCFFWFIYFEHMQGSSFVGDRRKVLITSCLVWVMGLLLVANLFTGILFYVDGGGTYHRGPLFAIQYLLSYIYVFAASGHALIGCFQQRKLSRKKLLISLALFPIAPAGAGILQFIYPEIPAACFALSFATLILYQNWLDDMLSVDPLTHLNNRKQLMYHYEQWQRHSDSTPLYLLLIDANKFKSINDIYGHIQGDAALERIAEALRLACKEQHFRCNIARYGGDEFVILARANNDGSIEELCSRINVHLTELNKVAEAPYELSVSVGAAKADRDKALKALINEADEKMYLDKMRRRNG